MELPAGIETRDYQKEAIYKWRNNGYIGIYDMATGTGKTITALLSVMNLIEHCSGKLAVIVLCPTIHLVNQWQEDVINFGIEPIIGYSGGYLGDYSRLLESKVRRFNLGLEDVFFLLITNDSFQRYDVQYILRTCKGPMLLISDEAHTMGSPIRLNYLTDIFDYRLALSATFERKWDYEGTRELTKYFGKIVFSYSLEKAIRNGILSPYDYYPIICRLSDIEYKEYIRLSKEITKYLHSVGGEVDISEEGKILLIQRSHVVATAQDKIRKLDEVLKDYEDASGMLVYCGSGNIFGTEERQLDRVTKLLNYHHIKAKQFTCDEGILERKELLNALASGQVQALTAIKCLDEGVNVPSIKTAFILASANNPKEYIQRRGRVLRKAPGKNKATIYDFVALPFVNRVSISGIRISGTKYDLSLVRRELDRIHEFNRLALNRNDIKSVIESIQDLFEIND